MLKKIATFSVVFGLLLIAYAGIEFSILNIWQPHDTILAVSGIILLLVYLVVDFKEIISNFSKRSSQLNFKTLFGMVLVFALLVVVNFISARRSFRFDSTANQTNSLSYQTIQILKDLEQEVKVFGFFRSEQSDQIRDLFGIYENYTDKITFKVVDPDKENALASAYQVEKYGTVVFDGGELKDFTTNISEQTITNGILNVTRKTRKGIYFSEGHKETDIHSEEKKGYSKIATKLYLQSYEPKKLVLAQTVEVPKDLSVLVIANPKIDFLEAEIDFLKKVLEARKSICVLVEPATDLPRLFSFLREWGIFVRDDVVVDLSPANQTYGGDPTLPLVVNYANHPITKKFGKILTVYPIARSVDTLQTTKPLLKTILASTSSESFGETDLKDGKVRFDPESDKQGPLGIAVVSEAIVSLDTQSPKVVVFGEAEFVDNFYQDKTGNADFFLNTISWLASDEDLIAIRANEANETKLVMTQGETVVEFMLTIFILPGFFFFLGIIVYLRRKE